jgi:hypothetical protein
MAPVKRDTVTIEIARSFMLSLNPATDELEALRYILRDTKSL